MKTTSAQKIKIGLFTIVGLGLLVIGVFLIGRQKSMFGNTFTIYGTFRNVGGLQVGNNVRFVGINVGTVENIHIISDTQARVDMRLQEKVRPYMKGNDVASIGSDGLMGDKLITISGSGEPGEAIHNGARIATINPIDYDKTINKITRVADNAEIITSALAGIVTQVQKGRGSVGALLFNDTLAKSIEGTVSSAHQTMQAIKTGSEGFSENMTALKHNFLLRGYYKKKEKRQEKKEAKKEEKAEKKEEKAQDK
jgi:phospholipid/cholesterol/gamma-HCH transport system substrate-binding protein